MKMSPRYEFCAVVYLIVSIQIHSVRENIGKTDSISNAKRLSDFRHYKHASDAIMWKQVPITITILANWLDRGLERSKPEPDLLGSLGLGRLWLSNI